MGRTRGFKHTEETKRAISIKNRGEKNGMWKGDNIKYRALHAWLVSEYGKANKCEKDLTHKGMFVWANISGKYLRDRNDFKMLCQSCHMKSDHDKLIKARPQYQNMLKTLTPYLNKQTPIRTIARLINIERHKILLVARREGYSYWIKKNT